MGTTGNNIIDGNLRITGQLNPASIRIPAGSIGDDQVQAGAGIDASKLDHQHAITYRQRTGADVATATEDLYTVRGATGLLIGVDVTCTTAPTGTSGKHFTVDVQKGNQSTAFATLLTAPVTIDNTIANRQVVPASLLASTPLADGDTLRVVVTASGSTGTQGQGLVVTITVREDAD